MKTAMQELIELLKELQLGAKKSGATEFQIAMTFAIGRAETKLEKEKEQIIDAFDYGYHCASNGTSAEITLDGEINYNQTYNQTNDK